MGSYISKFFRKKKTTEEVLDKLDKEIKSIEVYGKDTEQSQKKIVGRFLLISIIVYIGSALLLYFYFFPATLYERVWYIVPLLLAPFIIAMAKKGLTFYYSRRITKNQSKLKRLNDEKKKVLEKVMDTETYKVAKTILEKYAPEQIRKNNFPSVPSADITTPIKSNSLQIMPSTAGLRRRPVPGSTPNVRPAMSVLQTPARPVVSIPPNTASRTDINSMQVVPSNVGVFPSATPLPLPRGILARDRSVFDKMVEYLVGDGPSNRYALICKQCASHNGMALKEEFEYLSFRCCYCYTFNPAPKKRPQAPKLELSRDLRPLEVKEVESSESDKISSSESETDTENIDTLTNREPPTSDNAISDNESTVENLASEVKVEAEPMDIDTEREL